MTDRAANPRALAALFLLLSAAACVAVLACRNLYDDELLSLAFVVAPAREIVRIASEGDVHPAGMYLLGHMGWVLTGSYRWLNVVPAAVLYGGLSWFVVSVTPLLGGVRARACFLLLGALGPELLLWGNTFRWYCPWTGLGLAALVVALEPGVVRLRFSWGRSIVLGALLAAMFYLNYITLLFAVALAVALIVRYRRVEGGTLRRAAVGSLGTFVVLVALQVQTMVLVHLRGAPGQRVGVLASSARLMEGLTGSEAYLPWHPLALMAGLVLVLLWMCAAARTARMDETEDTALQIRRGFFRALAVFAIAFLVLVAVSGLGGKPRNAMLLIPVLGAMAALGMERLRVRMQIGVLAVLALWTAVGVAHLVGRFGVAKSGMDDRPEQVLRLIESTQAGVQAAKPLRRACGVVVVYDSGVAFALAQAKLADVLVVSPFRAAPFAPPANEVPAGCMDIELYVVESYIAGSPRHIAAYTAELAAAERAMDGRAAEARLSHDPDAGLRRRFARVLALSGGSSVPDDRFVVRYGPMRRDGLQPMLQSLPDFYSAQAHPPNGT